jgi:DNA (cytosine-5)-methyltransferase 1
MLIGIDLFAGAGGMSLGATNAGIEVRAAVEMREAACRTYERNHPGVKVHNLDIRSVHGIDVDRHGHELVVFGGPPCQGFSTSNQRTRNGDNPRNWLFLEFVRLVEVLSPEWLVFENVAGILQTDGGSFVQAFKDMLEKLGYRLSARLLNAADHGVPQRRSRYFVVGCRDRPPQLWTSLLAPLP